MNSVVRFRIVKNLYRKFSNVSTQKLTNNPIPGIFEMHQERIDEFEDVFPKLVNDIIKHNNVYLADINKRIVKSFDYNTKFGSKNRGRQFITSYKLLEKPENLTKDNMMQAYIMAWCLEIFMSAYAVSDDLMDNDATRRGRPCWHKLEGLAAVNDAMMFLCAVPIILQKYFSRHEHYIPIKKIFEEIGMMMSYGQCKDMQSKQIGQPNILYFARDRYKTMSNAKGLYAGIVAPTRIAMYLSGITEEILHQRVGDILSEVGYFYQIKNDFLDCYGNPNDTGKQPIDIRAGAFSWLAVVALEKATAQQIEVFKKHYGQNNPDSIKTIMNLYRKLNVIQIYEQHKEQSYNSTRTCIKHIPEKKLKNLLLQITDVIYDIPSGNEDNSIINLNAENSKNVNPTKH